MADNVDGPGKAQGYPQLLGASDPIEADTRPVYLGTCAKALSHILLFEGHRKL